MKIAIENYFIKKVCVNAFVIIAFSSPLITFSQNSGKIEYDIEVKGLTPEMEKGAVMLFNSKMTIAFADSNVRQDYKMGELSTKTTIINKTLNRAIFYENSLNGKIGVYGKPKEISSISYVDTAATVELTNEEKVILGFKCKKALYKFSSGETAEYWYTTELPVKFPDANFFNALIPGVPLEFSTSANGYFMRFKCNNYASSIENIAQYFNPVVDRDFKIIDFQSYMTIMLEQQQSAINEKEPTGK